MQLIQFDENKYEVNIYTIENEDSVIEELSMIVKKDNSFKTIYLQIRGEIDLDQIANVASELNAPGGDFLKKIN
jgi:acetolactate synthase regulatory subunit